MEQTILESYIQQKTRVKNIERGAKTQKSENKQFSFKNGQDINWHFTKVNIWMANKQMKICSISLAIGEMQIKTTVSYHKKRKEKRNILA